MDKVLKFEQVPSPYIQTFSQILLAALYCHYEHTDSTDNVQTERKGQKRNLISIYWELFFPKLIPESAMSESYLNMLSSTNFLFCPSTPLELDRLRLNVK